LGGFTPSIGFPAAQVASIQRVAVHAEAILCIENLTTFHEFARTQESAASTFAIVCILGNPSPAIRRLLRITPDSTPIYLWSDLDYGGFNILSQLRQQVGRNIQPYRMDIPTFEAHAHLSRPLSKSDVHNLRRLCLRPELQDVRPVMEHLLKRGLKIEQEAIS
jgi:DNA topoisomerase VI subunit A